MSLVVVHFCCLIIFPNNGGPRSIVGAMLFAYFQSGMGAKNGFELQHAEDAIITRFRMG